MIKIIIVFIIFGVCENFFNKNYTWNYYKD